MEKFPRGIMQVNNIRIPTKERESEYLENQEYQGFFCSLLTGYKRYQLFSTARPCIHPLYNIYSKTIFSEI